MRLGRRMMLGLMLGGVARTAFGEEVTVSPYPKARPEGLQTRAIPSGEDLVAKAGLGGAVAYAVAEAATGEMLEVRNPLLRLPPASVAKTVTALYALDHLGAEHRFVTRVIATGPVREGIVQGDLVLAGGGDPTLDTDGLGLLAEQLAEAGIRGVSGAFRLYDGALPRVAQIDGEQTEYAGYNPTIGGLNVNFNRVHFEWRRQGEDYSLRMDARAERFAPDVQVARVRISTRDAPVFDHEPGEERDEWTVARAALGNGGARWLPVRLPTVYAGEVFRAVAAQQGVTLDHGTRVEALPEGREVARLESAPLTVVVRDMLKYSTNLTAEVLGLAASRARGLGVTSLPASAAAMTHWARARLGMRHIDFVDHSGLGGASAVTVADLVHMLSAEGVEAQLAPLMKPVPMRDAQGNVMRDPPAQVHAKTGTLDFVSTLAGYAEAAGGRRMAFAIFAADLDRRAAAKAAGVEIPQGARGFNGGAKRLQQALLGRWAGLYGG
ncbi:D-alanyl-D-alanine carboxypeptidase/D-alanyl-D-alanine endopeptidase [Celeribacter indicus]|uniref:D-alanyl-D-alanine carboxypeptidase/D-alanyl-D-alanine-endopeptidase n=1 Tax=Celeribacter indicus TaxID=1208324 RepID=A0A0B5DXY1_9RHOB|nr:D-alanyl-D-alanine carboxypeptidase/D-alanyl-D-alanine-endopeptidase [Celeribacter indicus]AJE48293.1 D-alanyl-D-alanine carboxypeptidase/D-alanyl-D-alanine-endopeptidase [Celeribacter indicus]SDW71947.1 D-alanyl-D-alanine carboxypeptidase / D-alanyl-D-alanine-endopeptidase (penicillin-binding protein 4) [Celeribacter indicus]